MPQRPRRDFTLEFKVNTVEVVAYGLRRVRMRQNTCWLAHSAVACGVQPLTLPSTHTDPKQVFPC